MVASSRFFVLLATVSLFLAFMAVMVSTLIVTITTILHTIGADGATQNEMIGKLIKQADYALLATVLYVLALGLYSLFVDDRVPMPRWLRIHDLGQLKELLAGVVVVAIAVIFLGWALTWPCSCGRPRVSGRWSPRSGSRRPAAGARRPARASRRPGSLTQRRKGSASPSMRSAGARDRFAAAWEQHSGPGGRSPH
jgi:uncharacterized membrane protein YqhA